jgi:hypothetical protein
MLADWVEQDGLARSVLAILLITTLGCFTYTWGYYEVGVGGLSAACMRAGS